MATLILGTVGRALGGPLGGLVGTLVGGSIDQGIFGGGGRTREGPRVANLAVQSAAYGEPLPRLYGRMRVAGNLVWTAGIRETRTHTGGGKRGPATTGYTYLASFAVIVAARAIVRIERIWADGKLLRDADGTLILPATIRFYRGDEAQGVDPLIAAAEGIDAAPAYRDRAYAVFEDLPLADFGNRIPNLTFEVVADDGEVGAEAIAGDIAGIGGGDGGPPLLGFAAGRAGSVRSALTQVSEIANLVIRDGSSGLVLGASAAETAIAANALGATEARPSQPAWHATRQADGAIPDALIVGFSDPARDFQPGQQRAVRRTPVLRSETRDLPAALTATAGKQLAETLLRRAIARRTTATLALPWRHASLRPGDVVRVDDDADPWRIRRVVITGAVIEAEVERIATGSAAGPPADPGRVYAPGDAPHGPTVLHVLDLPALEGVATAPRLLLAVAGPSAGWRRADIVISRDAGHSYATVATVDAPATIGVAAAVLSDGITDRWDRVSTIDVDLLADTMTLDSSSEAAVLTGANLALVGDEIVQFAQAEAIGERRFRLSGLLRGRRGTEAAVSRHVAGERFVLLDDRVVAVDLPVDAIGAALSIKAVGRGEDVVAVAAREIVPTGAALRPLSPVAVSVVAQANGDRAIRWIRRSRAGYAWIDGADAPLGEEGERYRVAVAIDGRVTRSTDVDTAIWTYSEVAFAADAEAAASSLTVAVAQLSATVGAGAWATLPIDLSR